jgi:hypothetical protein
MNTELKFWMSALQCVVHIMWIVLFGSLVCDPKQNLCCGIPQADNFHFWRVCYLFAGKHSQNLPFWRVLCCITTWSVQNHKHFCMKYYVNYRFLLLILALEQFRFDWTRFFLWYLNVCDDHVLLKYQIFSAFFIILIQLKYDVLETGICFIYQVKIIRFFMRQVTVSNSYILIEFNLIETL